MTSTNTPENATVDLGDRIRITITRPDGTQGVVTGYVTELNYSYFGYRDDRDNTVKFEYYTEAGRSKFGYSSVIEVLN